MKCTCGAEYNYGEKFCAACGRELSGEMYSLAGSSDKELYTIYELKKFLKEDGSIDANTKLIKHPEGFETKVGVVLHEDISQLNKAVCACGAKIEKGSSFCSNCGREVSKDGYALFGSYTKLYSLPELENKLLDVSLTPETILVKFPECKKVKACDVINFKDISFCVCGHRLKKRYEVCPKCGFPINKVGFGIVGKPEAGIFSKDNLTNLLYKRTVKESTKLINFPEGKLTTVGEIIALYKNSREVSNYKPNKETSPGKEKGKAYPAIIIVAIIAAFVAIILPVFVLDAIDESQRNNMGLTGYVSNRVSKANYYRITGSMRSEDVQRILGSPTERTDNGVRSSHIWRSGERSIQVVYQGRNIVMKFYQDWTDINHPEFEDESY